MKLYIFIFSLLFSLVSAHARSNDSIQFPERGICAHRGAMEAKPENTLAAFREAVRLGAQMIEFDVRLTEDEHLVILHDPTVDRTTNGTGAVNDLTFAQVRKLDAGSWKSPEFKGECIPTLEETLAVMPVNIWLNVHLKGGRKLGEKVAQVIVKEKRTHQAFLACGVEAVRGAKEVSPEIMICNMERQTQTAEYVDETIKMHSNFIQLFRTQPGAEMAAMISKLKQNQIRVNYCCTDSPQTIKEIFKEGVDFVLVNQLEDMLQVADSLEIPRLKPLYNQNEYNIKNH